MKIENQKEKKEKEEVKVWMMKLKQSTTKNMQQFKMR